MRKPLTILLLAILVFNWVGYRLVSQWLEAHVNRTLEVSLDKNEYNEEDLVEIRVPINLPYSTDWKEFQRIDGEVRLGDVLYKYVKRKVENGQLVLLCLPNKSKMAVQTARDKFFLLVNDLQQESQSKDNSKVPTGHSFKSLFTEYWQNDDNWVFAGCDGIIQVYGPVPSEGCLSAFILPLLQPPDA